METDASRNKRGREAGRVRDAVCLPYAWNIPTDTEIQRVISRITLIADGRRRKPVRLEFEAALLSLLVMQTGQQPSVLLQFSAIQGPKIDTAAMLVGLCLSGTNGYIVIQSQTPKTLDYCSVAMDRTIIPMSGLLRQLLAGLNLETGVRTQLFQCDHQDVIAQANRICRGGEQWLSKTRKATRSLNAMRRWLRFRLRTASNGDAAMSAILRLNPRGVERTLAFYITMEATQFWLFYRRAIDAYLPGIPAQHPNWLQPIYFGRGTCPDQQSLTECVAQLKRHLQRPIFEPNLRASDKTRLRLGPLQISKKRHLAMMLYTYALVTFGTGQRYIKGLSSHDDVDPGAGFSWVTEKANHRIGSSGDRGVYHSKSVRRQLVLYENYLDKIEQKLSKKYKSLAEQLAALRTESGITFFEIAGNKVIRLKPSQLCVQGKTLGWRYTANAGRHWLRSRLTFAVQGDALAAQFGHLLSGFNVWGHFSGLEPALVGRAIEPAVERLLKLVGFAPAGASQKSRSVAIVPNFIKDPLNRRSRLGQILASAIWNGAMLNTRFENELVEKVEEARSKGRVRGWIQLDVDQNGGAQRWRIDSRTQDLLQSYMEKDVSFAGNPDVVLQQFLGGAHKLAVFRQAAEKCWRWRLPPILWAKAVGLLDNKSVTDDRFFPGGVRISRPRNEFSRRLTKEYRATGRQFEKFVLGHWEATHGKPTWKRKKLTYLSALETIDNQPFMSKMSVMENSVARAIVEQFHSDASSPSVRSYSGSTIMGRINQLWRSFLPSSEQHEDWESCQISEASHCLIFSKMSPIPRRRANVAAAIKTILETLPRTAESEETISKLNEIPENRMQEVLHPIEYTELRKRSDQRSPRPLEKPVYALCYRAGIRISELSAAHYRSFLQPSTDRFELLLDHTIYRRLKTFHSRRRVPLDLLFTDIEIQELKTALKPFADGRFSIRKHLGYSVENLDDDVREATGFWAISGYSLRHSFATNCLAAMLWPKNSDTYPSELLDEHSMNNRNLLRSRLQGAESLGAIGPHALANLMGHTSPWRTLYNYAHHLELALAEHVEPGRSIDGPY